MRAQIVQAVDLAFSAIDDLKTSVILKKKTDSGFDFAERRKIDDEKEKLTVYAFVRDTESREGTTIKRLLFKTSDVGDIKAFDSVEIAGVKYRLGPNPVDNGYIVKVDALNG